MRLFHATSMDNLISIMENGLHTGLDGVVYLAEKEVDAARFVVLKAVALNFDILVVEVEVPEDLIRETFDHSDSYFKCKAYGCSSDIPRESIIRMSKFLIKDIKRDAGLD